jgi:hypothetical protein
VFGRLCRSLTPAHDPSSPPQTNCAPTYDQLDSVGKLWPCPTGQPKSGCCGADTCVQSITNGTGNPTCPGQLNATHSCCCPMEGCYTEPLFNTVIGVCKGEGCACGGSVAPGCAPDGDSTKCGSYKGTKCTGATVRFVLCYSLQHRCTLPSLWLRSEQC